MIEKITADELELISCLCYPPSAISCVFSDLDNFLLEDETKFAQIRPAQEAVLSFEYMIDDDPALSNKENFQLKVNSGSIECFGGRKWGKTYIVEKVDIFMTLFWLEGEHIGFTSIDALHIRGVLEEIINTIENHTLFKSFCFRVNRSPNYRISNKSGYLLESINMNILSRNPGQAFFQKHLKRLYIEEASLETDEVFSKRNEAVSEVGCVVRSAGMTNFTKYSPAGRRFYDIKNKDLVCNLPQYVSPAWNKKEKERAVREHGGESSLSYRIFVKGEIAEDGVSVFDMIRVRANYLENKVIKHFEVTKDNFLNFKEILILDRPKGVDEVYICADIGETAATEIIVIFKIDNTYFYHYNITCYNLTDKQQSDIFFHLISKLEANVIGIDTTDGTGRAILRKINEIVPLNNLVACSFNEKLAIDFDRDDKGIVKFDTNGKPLYKEEYVSEWSVNRLKELFYDGRLKCPIDYKLDKQMNSVIANQTASRTVYTVVSEEDHLFSAFRVFAISVWQKEFSQAQSIRSKKFSKSGV